jgi:hypothetical protein
MYFIYSWLLQLNEVKDPILVGFINHIRHSHIIIIIMIIIIIIITLSLQISYKIPMMCGLGVYIKSHCQL